MKTVNDIPGLKELLDDCQKKASDLIGKPVKIHYSLKIQHMSTDQLATIICNVCEVTWDMIKSESRKAQITIARHFYCYFAYVVQKKQLEIIAGILNKDHTTIIHGRDKIINMIETNDELYMPYYNEIERKINEILLPDEVKA